MTAVRVGFLCMESVFSVRPLEALLADGHDVRFVMRPIGGIDTRKKPVLKRHRGFDVAVRRALGLQQKHHGEVARDPFHVAARADVPAYLVGDASCPQAVELVKREKVDIVVVAFFNQLLKPSFLAAAPLGAINLHPSLLPRYRGPAPLFWTFRDGCDETGLTLHRISPREDDGDVLLQQRLPLELGTPGEELVDELAEHAGTLTSRAVRAIANGEAQPAPQDHAQATRAPRPTDHDLVVDASMGARRVFHFVRGVGRWNATVVDFGGTRVRVVDAVELDEGRALPGETALVGELLHLGCADGVVVLRTRNMPPH